MKEAIQRRVDELVKGDGVVKVFWVGREEAENVCISGAEGVRGEGEGEEESIRVVDIGGKGEGCYPCGGTHVGRLGEVGRVVVRGIKRQKGISRVGYEVVDG